MVRLCLTLSAALLSAWVCAGCSGQNVEGAWRGSFPLNGVDSCEVRLQMSSQFTISCASGHIMGGGRYTWNGRDLSLSVSHLAYDGKLTGAKPVFTFTVEGKGNMLELKRNGEKFEWKRAPVG